MKRIFFLIVLTVVSLRAFSQNDTLLNRVEKLGATLIEFSRSGDYGTGVLPEDVAYLRNKTVWRLFEITDPIAELNFKVHDASNLDQRADFILDVSDYIGLRVKYDPIRDKFHILGYFSSVTKIRHSYRDSLIAIEKRLSSSGDIRPHVGILGIEINKTSKTELFSSYPETVYNRIGIYFSFDQQSILKAVYFSNFQFKTTKEIRPQHSIKKNVTLAYGEPLSTSTELNVNGRKIGGVSVLNYDGIAFVCMGATVVMTIIK